MGTRGDAVPASSASSVASGFGGGGYGPASVVSGDEFTEGYSDDGRGFGAFDSSSVSPRRRGDVWERERGRAASRSPDRSHSRSRSRTRNRGLVIGNLVDSEDDDDFTEDGHLSDGIFDDESTVRPEGVTTEKPARRAVKAAHASADAARPTGVVGVRALSCTARVGASSSSHSGGVEIMHRAVPTVVGAGASTAAVKRDAAKPGSSVDAAPAAAGADGMKLGSFMYVRNAKWTVDRDTPDNPKFWVGRVAEIIRGGRVRLHWHR
jgi:hypothetical protein